MTSRRRHSSAGAATSGYSSGLGSGLSSGLGRTYGGGYGTSLGDKASSRSLARSTSSYGSSASGGSYGGAYGDRTWAGSSSSSSKPHADRSLSFASLNRGNVSSMKDKFSARDRYPSAERFSTGSDYNSGYASDVGSVSSRASGYSVRDRASSISRDYSRPPSVSRDVGLSSTRPKSYYGTTSTARDISRPTSPSRYGSSKRDSVSSSYVPSSTPYTAAKPPPAEPPKVTRTKDYNLTPFESRRKTRDFNLTPFATRRTHSSAPETPKEEKPEVLKIDSDESSEGVNEFELEEDARDPEFRYLTSQGNEPKTDDEYEKHVRKRRVKQPSKKKKVPTATLR